MFHWSRLRWQQFMLSVLVTLSLSAVVWAVVTPEQRKQISDIESELAIAGRLYTANKFDEAATKLTGAEKSLVKLMESKDPALHKALKPLFSRIERAHALLELEGSKLEELPKWEQLVGEAGSSPASEVSFKNDIAPFLITNCGKCHVDAKRGQFSMSTFDDLMEGINGRKVVNPGVASGSRIVQVLESGSMPPNGQVKPDELTRLTKWIDAGAKFDGADSKATLKSMANGINAPVNNPESEANSKPTGQETVTFSKDIAPILMENCNGCHINGRRASGNLSMNSFASLMRGGDAGKPWIGGKPDESLLIKKLRGQVGQRMPMGRPALSDEKIALIATWIKENATFDGSNPGLGIESVISQAWAARASHKELLAKRTERARSLWSKVLTNSDPSVAANDQLVVMGNVTQGRADEWLAAGDAALVEVRKQLKVPAGDLVKGGISIFIYKGRYDYSEFGRMNENRKLPNNWQGHWRASPLDVYIALVDDTKLDAKQQQGLLIQYLAGAYVGSLPQTPEWFAEGVARNVAKATAARGDMRIEQWNRSLATAASLVDKSESFLEGRLDDEASGVIGMKLTSVMMERRNRKQFDGLLGQMREGKPFPDAFTQAFTTPEKFVKSWLGK